MAEHSVTFVPLDTWCYQSPELRYEGKLIDFGLFCESLLYYDQVIINVGNEEQFVLFLNWFIKQGKFQDLIALIEEDIIKFYNYAFVSAPILLPNGNYNLVNLQDEVQKSSPNSFEEKYLDNRWLNQVLKSEKFRRRFKNLVSDRVIEVKASKFENTINNAHEDFKNPERNSLALQALFDNTYNITGMKKPFHVVTTLKEHNGIYTANYNFDFKKISIDLGKNLNFHQGTPLAGLAVCNKYIQSSMYLNCDLYLSSPMSNLVGDKLYESAYKVIKSKDIIENLEAEVEFPDVRTLVNDGKLSFENVLNIRKKSDKFRKWLQEEGEHDRNAIIAYHHEVAKESGFRKYGRKYLNVFGVLTGVSVGAIISKEVDTTTGVIAGGSIGTLSQYVINVASNLGKDWKPVVFGDWMKDRIDKILQEK